MDTKGKGELSQAAIQLAMLKAGWIVLVPYGDNQRYDLATDWGGRLVRIQVKTGRLKDGVITFNTCSTCVYDGSTKDYRGEADYFGVYCEELDKCYLIPVSKVGTRACSLRLTKSKNNQKIGVHLASDYELKPTHKRQVGGSNPSGSTKLAGWSLKAIRSVTLAKASGTAKLTRPLLTQLDVNTLIA